MAETYQAKTHSLGESMDYTPSSAVAAGDVVVQGELVGVAKTSIAANVKGALSLEGVFTVVKLAAAVAVGDLLYWDITGNPYGGTAGSGARA